MKKYKVIVTIDYGEDGYIYKTEKIEKETVAVSEAKAKNNVCWRMLGKNHKNGFVDYQPYSDKYYKVYNFEAVEI